jgi:hypothetical protein
MIFGREPAAIAAFIQAILALGVGFGLSLSTEQMGLLMAVVTIGLGLLVRQVVTPLAAPKLDGGSTVELTHSGTSVTLPEA